MSCGSAVKIITGIYSLPEIDDCISKLVTKELRPDFKQELFLILLGIDCDKINQMNGSLKYFVVRIILNLVRQKRNIFHRTYLDKTIEYNTDKINYQASSPADHDTMMERIERENKEDQTISKLYGIDENMGNKEYPYHQEIIKLILECGSMREVSRRTGIPDQSVRNTVYRVRKYLKG